jgi:hypothetical protein
MSEQKPSHGVKGIIHRALTQIWGRVPTHSAALKVPKNTVASIILKWKKFGTTKTLPRSGHSGQTEQLGEKCLGQGGDQEPDGHSVRALQFLCGDGRTFQKDNHLCSSPPIRTSLARWKPLLSKRHMTARLELAKRHLKTLRP